ncbi:SixA phosphatase family protein [Henriciella aquimarina]|uniref:SixA phosphatase family protein n=1 Tax=Henriciella aquimarina TaxID=545261 RepID=UPI000A07ABAB|nr:phosphoglycerate mutase family protein [Henriciella aquimarina]
MKPGWITTLAALFSALTLAQACSAERDVTPSAASEAGFTVYLVRHAEKTGAEDDPELTADGMARAETLAEVLADEPIEVIWSSDYTRTRQTAAPLAERLRMDVQLYDASDLPGFAETLEAAGETAVVVGHSNTTPALSALLGGDGGTPIDEAREYDRLYVLSGVGTGSVETDIRRYGARYDGGDN